MRLLHVGRLEFTEFHDDKRPPYVIASHRWRGDSEVTFQDVRNRRNEDKDGYKKIEAFAKYTRDHIPLIEWLWIDTCCINKDSAAELSEAINLMFEWYRNAEICLAYLADVLTVNDKAEFEHSEWFKRGWTLQELLAPRVVIFVTEGWQVIGSKGSIDKNMNTNFDGLRLEKDIARITRIPEHVLYDFRTSSTLSIDQKLKWMESRSTTREEDMSYALYGIFDVAPGANYGEKRERANQRLLAAIHHQDNIAAQQAERFRQIVEWLSPPEPWTNHASARDLHEPQTGTWLMQSEQYQRWKSASTRHLWLHGKAGCGKTILCSTAVEDLKEHCKHRPDAAYAVFYFSFSDDKKQRTVDLICSLVAQLGWKGPALLMLQRMHDTPYKSLPGLDELEEILFLCFEAHEEVFLLLDALDECPEVGDLRHIMLERLAKVSQKAPHVKIMATSREMLDIRECMVALGSEAMPLVTDFVNVDIQQYVSRSLSRDLRLSRLDIATKELIESTISAKADGMFRWAYCQLQELKRLPDTRLSYIRKALYNLPATLDETYARMLTGIGEAYRSDALTLLRWLAYARSPPTLGQLAETVIIDIEADRVDTDDRGSLEGTLNILSGLVTVVRADGDASHDLDPLREDLETTNGQQHTVYNKDTMVRLAHFSVKEYLESVRIRESRARTFHLEPSVGHRIIAQSCLLYLIHYSRCDDKLLTPRDLDAFPLIGYAAKSWFHHSVMQQPGDMHREALLLSSDDLKLDWLRIYDPHDYSNGDFHEPSVYSVERCSGLYYASLFGLEAVVTLLINQGSNVNGESTYNVHALLAASSRGHMSVVKVLVDSGADVDVLEIGIGNALRAASMNGHVRIVRFLLEHGANPNLQAAKHGCALQAAASRGHIEIVKLLLRSHADVNVQDGDCGNALQAASASGHTEIVKILLETGADVNAQGGAYGSALQAASSSGHVDIVELLLMKGASVHESRIGAFGNALFAAVAAGESRIVKLLLARSVDVDEEGHDEGNHHGAHYGQPLYVASVTGQVEVVEMLLNSGADVDAQGGHIQVDDLEYGNALQAAICEGHSEIVQLLLSNGAHINARGGRYGNALQAASQHGNLETVQLLLENGARVNTQSGKYGCALQAAASQGHIEIVKLLLHTHANVNIQGEEYGNALQAASAGGFIEVVKLLLEKEADADAQGGCFGNALQAASRGYIDIVALLLNHGADVNKQGGHYGSPLQAASSNDNTEIAKLLLDHGADPNLKAGNDGWALRAASRGNHVKVVQLLLANGADVNVQEVHKYDSTALQIASEAGYLEIVELLIDNGAKLNSWGDDYGTALDIAISSDHVDVVRVLLERGARLDASGYQYEEVNELAASTGNVEIVKLLLLHDVNANANEGEYDSALRIASKKGYVDIVRLLLDHGADVNAQGGEFGNALQAASYGDATISSLERCPMVVKLLLDRGAAVNAQGGTCGSALQAASSQGHVGIVKLLLEHNADVNVQGGERGNALQAASEQGHAVIVRLLLKVGADVNAQGGMYGNALQAVSYGSYSIASIRRCPSVAKLLLDAGANVNARGGKCGSALQAASQRGSVKIVKLLLCHHADVNARGGEHGNALQAASASGHAEIVELLLDGGAEINARGGKFASAFQAASSRGHKDIIEVFLKRAPTSAFGGVDEVEASIK